MDLGTEPDATPPAPTVFATQEDAAALDLSGATQDDSVADATPEPDSSPAPPDAPGLGPDGDSFPPDAPAPAPDTDSPAPDAAALTPDAAAEEPDAASPDTDAGPATAPAPRDTSLSRRWKPRPVEAQSFHHHLQRQCSIPAIKNRSASAEQPPDPPVPGM